MATRYSRLVNHSFLKCQTVFLARFDKQDEDDQVLEEAKTNDFLRIKKNYPA